jgi:hypothetical protein
VTFAVREAAFALVLLPLAMTAFALFWVPYHVTGFFARRATRERDVAASATVFVGAAVYAVWLIVIAITGWRLSGGRAAAIAAVAVPALALIGLFAIERESAVVATARAWLSLRRARAESRERLKRARSEIALLLDDVYEWLSAETPARGDAQTQS